MAVTNAFVKGMCEGGEYESEIITISDLNVTPCMGCLSCWARTEGECVIKNDDMPAVKKRIEEADIIIESYPLYFFGMPGQMKLFTDRLLSMMCTYRGQKPPENGESFHGIRNPKTGQKLVLISGCAYSALVPAMLMGCGKKEASTGSDLEYIKQKGTLVVGITDFAPMDYQDADGSWIGFDADLAKAFAESLGVEVQFQTIEWDNKVMELDGKTIDVVWNGMTLTDEVTSSMACSNAYCNNAQVVILPADKAADYGTVDSLSGLRFAVESGSAGMAQAEEKGLTYTDVVDQATALLEVKSGTADAAIIDSLMAGAMVGEGTNYADLAIGRC